jgi:hypothetical protein
MAFKQLKQEQKELSKDPYQQHGTDCVRCLLELLKVAAVGNDHRLPRGASVQTPIFIVHSFHALSKNASRRWLLPRSRGVAVTAHTLGGGRRTTLDLFASGAAAVPTPAAALITSAAEAAGDSTTGICGALVPNASFPEAFFLLSDVIGGTLLSKRAT